MIPEKWSCWIAHWTPPMPYPGETASYWPVMRSQYSSLVLMTGKLSQLALVSVTKKVNLRSKSFHSCSVRVP